MESGASLWDDLKTPEAEMKVGGPVCPLFYGIERSGSIYNVAKCSVSGFPLSRHSRQYWNVRIYVVVHTHFHLVVAFAMQAAHVLCERAFLSLGPQIEGPSRGF